ncbi:MAG: cob(I)yrinic acid a,c-diamide adenosyltransferase [Oscillospiraceae bacterium]|nr:cob(I)yrinic acid a,c-diamide adenosyltransferase [Oscillospiraceae bacterium]
MEKGKVHIYCGDGKGKTTAAAGLAARMAGNGYNVAAVQFLKAGGAAEFKLLSLSENVAVVKGPEKMKFIFQMNDEEKRLTADLCDELFKDSVNLAGKTNARLLVMDEVLDAVECGMLDEGKLYEFLRNRPQQLEVVLTGRKPSQRIAELADYITEMKKLRHPYEKGEAARKGIEY